MVVMSQKSSMSIFECTTDKYSCKSFNQKYFLGKTAFEKISLSLSIYRKMVGSIPLTHDMLFHRLLGGKKLLLFTSELASQYVHTMFYIGRLKSRSPKKSTTPLLPFFTPSDFWGILCPALKQLVFLNRNILFELIEANILFELIEANVMMQISAQGDDDSDEDVVICKLITNFFMITLGKRNSVKVILEVSADHCGSLVN